MPARTKRTYSLRPETVARVRELAARYGSSQDAVVDRAIDELERGRRDEDETEAWARAAEDPEFRRESAEVAATFDEADRWPA
jgi:predicted transcriptional regulator